MSPVAIPAGGIRRDKPLAMQEAIWHPKIQCPTVTFGWSGTRDVAVTHKVAKPLVEQQFEKPRSYAEISPDVSR
ncbi:hypothetical protein CC2G_009001 [Coprinopsis cinerea AmutBmut pab1-1]|nr:hypothetical protein CC2G_009001 [Coprinopsis cinerea AmutBmut pab1-1]